VSILNGLNALERFEGSVAKLYARLSEAHAQDQDAASLFYRMSLDEKNHASLIQYQRRVIKQNPDLFDALDFDVAAVEMATAYVEGLLDRRELPGLRDAVALAAGIESGAAEAHFRAALLQAAPDLSKLMRGLGDSDRLHADTLHAFGVRRGFIQPQAAAGGVGR
jgi:hypothetical protein